MLGSSVMFLKYNSENLYHYFFAGITSAEVKLITYLLLVNIWQQNDIQFVCLSLLLLLNLEFYYLTDKGRI